MNEARADGVYRMNPATDRVVYGDELEEGMWVLASDPEIRRPNGDGEDEQLRGQRFRRVTRLRREPGSGRQPSEVIFIGEWVDGYQEVHRYGVTHGWIVGKDPAGGADEDPGTGEGEGSAL